MHREGTWWIESKTDKRWNCGGRAYASVLSASRLIEDKIDELTRRYGDPPDDIEVGFMKD